MNTPTWAETFAELATVVAKRSKDRSTKVGAVIVGPDNEVRSVGYNGFPRGINDDIEERHERPEKYLWTEHAERNAIYNATRVGIPTLGCTMYVTIMPCMDCARAIIQSGIYGVIIVDKNPSSGWESEQEKAIGMLREAGVYITAINGAI